MFSVETRVWLCIRHPTNLKNIHEKALRLLLIVGIINCDLISLLFFFNKEGLKTVKYLFSANPQKKGIAGITFTNSHCCLSSHAKPALTQIWPSETFV